MAHRRLSIAIKYASDSKSLPSSILKKYLWKSNYEISESAIWFLFHILYLLVSTYKNFFFSNVQTFTWT